MADSKREKKSGLHSLLLGVAVSTLTLITTGADYNLHQKNPQDSHVSPGYIIAALASAYLTCKGMKKYEYYANAERNLNNPQD